ncbi:hypothetical protein BC829DRAFT_389757 [Chytridium lagenaria]|nr:hypothetical protein BC829DRAFT_389757 [Chytridium lagenaria]
MPKNPLSLHRRLRHATRLSSFLPTRVHTRPFASADRLYPYTCEFGKKRLENTSALQLSSQSGNDKF